MLVSVTVTQEHIDRGVPGEARACPWKLAISERFSIDDVYVGSFGTWIGSGCNIPHTNELYHWIKNFDSGDGVPPLTVEFDIPDELVAIPVVGWPVRVPELVKGEL